MVKKPHNQFVPLARKNEIFICIAIAIYGHIKRTFAVVVGAAVRLRIYEGRSKSKFHCLFLNGWCTILVYKIFQRQCACRKRKFLWEFGKMNTTGDTGLILKYDKLFLNGQMHVFDEARDQVAQKK